MRFDAFSFGSIQIDGLVYDHDIVIDRGAIRKRKKQPSKKRRDAYGHTPLSAAEEIPWRCRRLVVGRRDELATHRVELDEVRFTGRPPDGPLACQARLRYRIGVLGRIHGAAGLRLGCP